MNSQQLEARKNVFYKYIQLCKIVTAGNIELRHLSVEDLLLKTSPPSILHNHVPPPHCPQKTCFCITSAPLRREAELEQNSLHIALTGSRTTALLYPEHSHSIQHQFTHQDPLWISNCCFKAARKQILRNESEQGWVFLQRLKKCKGLFCFQSNSEPFDKQHEQLECEQILAGRKSFCRVHVITFNAFDVLQHCLCLYV